MFLKARAHVTDVGVQLLGMVGLLQTYRRTLPWAWRLLRGKIESAEQPPISQIPIRSADGRAASHALPAQDESNLTMVTLKIPVQTPRAKAG